MNPSPNPSSDDKRNQASESVTHYVDQLAIGLGVEIPPERTALYVQGLSDLSEVRIHHGFTRALQLFRPDYGRTFPAPGDIRAWALEWRPEPVDARDMAAQNAKLLDSSTPEERQNYMDALAEEMQKAIAAGAFSVKSHAEIAKEYASERLVKSTMPEDPAERAIWHDKMARKMGWKE